MSEKISNDDIDRMFHSLDSEMKTPEPPDVSFVFESADTPKNNAIKFPWSKIAGVAAVAAIAVFSVSYFTRLPMKAADRGIMEEAPAESVENAEEEMMLAPDSEYGEDWSDINDNSVYDALADGFASETGPGNPVYDAVEKFYSQGTKGPVSESGKVHGDKSFTVDINKQRYAEIDISEDGTAVTILDGSGTEPEILNAVWAEGSYQSSESTSKGLKVTLLFHISREDFDNMDIMPYIMGPDGSFALDEEDVAISDTVSLCAIRMEYEFSAEDGSYTVSATLI